MTCFLLISLIEYQHVFVVVDVEPVRCATKLEFHGVVKRLGLRLFCGEIYLYVRMSDVNGCEGSDLEVLMHIQIVGESDLVMPEVVSDDIINTLSTAIQLINSFAN